MGVPGNANALLLRSAAAAGGYQVSRSLRFNGATDSSYLSRTPASAGNRRTWTWSAWVKLAALSSGQNVIFSATDGSTPFAISAQSSGQILFGSLSFAWKETTAVFRDHSAWYHFCVAVDTNQASNANRLRFYVNGIEQTAFSTNRDLYLNTDLAINGQFAHEIGRYSAASNQHFNGYLAECHLIDGQQLTPSSFAETDATTGQWIPKLYTGSYGTNGFKLSFSDNSTTAALGTDSSGAGNTWTTNNFSVTAGSGNDSLVDTPTSYGTDTGVGGEVRGNYCTWNPLFANSAFTISNGNLDLATSSVSDRVCTSTFGLSSGKWYWEITVNGGAGVGIGVCTSAVNLASYLGGTSASRSYDWSANKYPGGASYGTSYTTGDVIGVAVDVDAGTLVYYKNGASQGTAFTDLAGSAWFPALGDQSNSGNVAISANFGQRPFAYTAPSGFKALVDTNLTAPVIAKPNTVMDVKLYTGNGSTQNITGLGFNPDLVWAKSRSSTAGHGLFDSVRGVSKSLSSHVTDAEGVGAAGTGVSAFNSDGFSLGPYDAAFAGNINPSGASLVAWCWDAGTSTVSNTQGSITSSVRANASAGFAVITGSTPSTNINFTFGHGLGVAPSLVIYKHTAVSGNWQTYHRSGGGNNYNLNSTAGPANSGTWSGLDPTSTLITIPSGIVSANSSAFVCYAFAPVAGYSSFGSYTGNGSTTDNTFVYTGMRPRFVMLKRSDSTGNWVIWDAVRNSYNVANSIILPNSSAAEYSPDAKIDILSNGFKVRDNSSDSGTNGATYIYAAFAESPFAYARAR